MATSSLLAQTPSQKERAGWEEQLQAIALELKSSRGGRLTPEIESKIDNFLKETPVQILLEQQVWNTIGAYITDPYSNAYKFIFKNIQKYPRQMQSDITLQLNNAMNKAMRELTSIDLLNIDEGADKGMEHSNEGMEHSKTHAQSWAGKANQLRELLELYQLPKSAFYLTTMEITNLIRERQYHKVLSIIEFGNSINLFYKEDRYVADLLRELLELAPNDKELAQRVMDVAWWQMEATIERSRNPINNYDILWECSNRLGNPKKGQEYKEAYNKLEERNSIMYGDFIKLFNDLKNLKKEE